VSQAHVDIVRSMQPSGVDLVEVFEQGRFEQVAAFADPQGVFDPAFETSFIASEAAAAARVSYRGAQGLVDGWREWLEAWDRYELEAEDFIDGGDEVVVMVRVRARTRRGGVEMQHAPAAVWGFKHGAVVRIDFYLERAQALRAVGLESR
jgi:ketosteroid isomerase-like protein